MLIVAGPTTGKTTLVAKCREEGIDVLDTDEIIESLYPKWFEHSLYMVDHPDMPHFRWIFARGVGMAVRYVLVQRPTTVVFSNIWSPSFLDCWNPSVGIGTVSKAEVALFRHDPKEIVRLVAERGDDLPIELVRAIVRLAAERGDDLPTELVRAWATDVEARMEPISNREPVLLEEGEFLSDVIKFSSHI